MPLSTKDIANKIHEEHDYLKQEMRKIRGMMKCDVTAEDYPKWRMDFIWLLRDFATDLQKHFDLEEEGGFMADVIRKAPQHANAVEKLEREHETINANLTEIIADLKKMEMLDADDMKSVCKRVDELLLLLAEHEAAEGNLLETTYLLDYGGGD